MTHLCTNAWQGSQLISTAETSSTKRGRETHGSVYHETKHGSVYRITAVGNLKALNNNIKQSVHSNAAVGYKITLQLINIIHHRVTHLDSTWDWSGDTKLDEIMVEDCPTTSGHIDLGAINKTIGCFSK